MMKKMLEDYYGDMGRENDFTVVITETLVGGPLYGNDRDNVEKYQPFQYISLSSK